jgi:methionyl-tRNA formyltransferase
MPIDAARLLVVTSPPLRDAVAQRLRARFPEAALLVWTHGDRAGRAAVRNAVLAGDWRFCISVYSDYVFTREEIARIGPIVNVHPALPHLRGRGYDTLPLVRGDRRHGATLHFVDERIDAGPIVGALSRPLAAGTRQRALRARNQRLSLAMFAWVLAGLASADLAAFLESLRRRARAQPLRWHGELLDSAGQARLLRTLRERDPGHPALDGIDPALIGG